MIYVLEWKIKDKNKKSNARIYLHGFQNEDTTSGNAINVEITTLSKLGRISVFCWGAMKKYQALTADVKSASER